MLKIVDSVVPKRKGEGTKRLSLMLSTGHRLSDRRRYRLILYVLEEGGFDLGAARSRVTSRLLTTGALGDKLL